MVPFCDVTLYPQGAEKGDITKGSNENQEPLESALITYGVEDG